MYGVPGREYVWEDISCPHQVVASGQSVVVKVSKERRSKMALKLSGNVLSVESETVEYQSKKTGQRETLARSTIILQGDYGVLVGSVFNPKTDMSTVKAGQKITVEFGEYKVDSGIQRAVFRM